MLFSHCLFLSWFTTLEFWETTKHPDPCYLYRLSFTTVTIILDYKELIATCILFLVSLIQNFYGVLTLHSSWQPTLVSKSGKSPCTHGTCILVDQQKVNAWSIYILVKMWYRFLKEINLGQCWLESARYRREGGNQGRLLWGRWYINGVHSMMKGKLHPEWEMVCLCTIPKEGPKEGLALVYWRKKRGHPHWSIS